MNEALRPETPLEANLRVLTDEVGGRVPGTPEFDKARRWAIRAFREAGADSITTEDFTVPQSWTEGNTDVEVVAPARFRVRAQAVAWAPPLVPTRARVVDIGIGSASEIAKAGDFSGAILLLHSDVLKSWEDLFNEYFRAPPILDFAVKGRALAVAFTSTREHDLLYRHINSITGRIDVIPQVLLAREDSLRIQRMIEHGDDVRMSLSIPNKIGPAIASQNIIAELRGSERRDEVVILGAHLDSWNLGTGALDNGCNAALMIDALRAIRAAGGRPKRTLRFILFSGEEEGLFGSLAYVRAHRKELDNIVAELVLDAGDGAITGVSTQGRKDVESALRPLLQPFARWKATGITNDAELGTDNFDFMLEGVPTLLPNQEPANYLANYHASSDTFDKVDVKQLKINEAIVAGLALELANAPQRIGVRYTRSEIETTFPDTHLDDQMKGFRLWGAWVNGTRGRKP
ncbi:MAG: M20/M25/M40 family metallo-hydrolase [Acidobacteriaceae bacterium]|nr:M20/M25/M40 family metallo-hydrolase [Acidobacteriaceae bacterium]